MKRQHQIAICLTALGVRLLAVWSAVTSHPASWFFGQATELAALAENLRRGQGLSSPFGGHTGPSAFLAPGYPAIVAAIFAVFQPYSIASAVALMLLEAMFGALTVLLVMRLSSRFGPTVANLAGLFCALSPPLIFLPTLFWETSLSILLAICLTAVTIPSPADARPRCLALGLLGAASLLVNPSLLTILVCCFAWIFFSTRRAEPLAGLLLCLVLSTPWAIRNQRQLHAFIPLRDNLGYELWQGNCLDSQGYFSPDFHPNTNPQEFLRYQQLGEVAYMQEKSEIARTCIASHPARFAALTLRRAFYFWIGRARQSAGLVIVSITLISLLGLAGMISLWKQQRNLAVMFLFIFMLFPLPYYITHPDFRFRLVLEPMLDILAAYFLARLFRSGFDLQHVAELDPALRDPSRR